MVSLSSPLVLAADPVTILNRWEQMLKPGDVKLLKEIRARGADLRWVRKELRNDSGRTVIHHSAVVAFRGQKAHVTSSGPVDFRGRDPEAMVLRLVRSALHQAHAKFQTEKLAR